MNTFEKVYELVKKIPAGKVTTYGEISKSLGVKNPRIVGFALHVNRDPDNIPCHRVVNKKGELAKGYAFGGLGIQKKLLKEEGVKFEGEKVDIKNSFYSFT